MATELQVRNLEKYQLYLQNMKHLSNKLSNVVEKVKKRYLMAKDWQKLMEMTGGEPLIVERVRTSEEGISIEGDFELPPLAQLSADDQYFVAAFVRSHGSIKEMERLFGVSYPTIKNRLRQIEEKLQFMDIDVSPPESSSVLDRLEAGEITAEEAMELLKKK
jgi:hypothetical protein